MSVQGFGVFPGDCADGLSLGICLAPRPGSLRGLLATVAT